MLWNFRSDSYVREKDRSVHNGVILDAELLRSELDIFGEYKDKINFNSYLNHRTKRVTFNFTIMLGILFLFYLTPAQLIIFISDFGSDLHSLNYIARCSISTCSLACCLFCLTSSISICWMKWVKINKAKEVINKIAPEENMSKKSTEYPWLSVCFSLMIQLHFILVFIRRTLSYNCGIAYENKFLFFGSGQCYDDKELPFGVLFNGTIMIALPVFIFIGISNVSVRVIWCNVFAAFVVFVIISVYLNIFQTVFPQFCFWTLLVCSCIIDLQYHGIIDYAVTKKIIQLHQSIDVMKEEAEKTFQEEMRILVGNIAHDIKSPLTSFMMGIDYIDHMMLEMSLLVESTTGCSSNNNATTSSCTSHPMPSTYMNRITDIQSCLNSLRTVHFYTLMVVNRCQDFYKATTGMHLLVPQRHEISLPSLIDECLHHMKQISITDGMNCGKSSEKSNSSEYQENPLVVDDDDVRDHITVHWNLPNDILQQIREHTMISDYLWLEENILCLLTNAMKFRHEKDIELHINWIAPTIPLNSYPAAETRQVNCKTPLQHANSNVTSALTNRSTGRSITSNTTPPITSSSSSNSNNNPSANSSSGKYLFQMNARRVKPNHPVFHATPSNHSSIVPDNSSHVDMLKMGKDILPNGTNIHATTKSKFATPGNNKSRAAGYIEFRIVDDGKTLNPFELSQFFNLAKYSGRYTGGIGLGLIALAKRVEALGGTYGVQCHEEQHSCSLLEKANGKENQERLKLCPDHDNNIVFHGGTEVWFRIPYKSSVHLNNKQKVSFPTNDLLLSDTNKSPPSQLKVIPSILSTSTGSAIANHYSEASISSIIPTSTTIPLLLPAEPTAATTSLLVPTSVPIPCGHILIVDDSASIIKMLSMMLKKLGYTVSTALHGKAAVELIQASFQQQQPVVVSEEIESTEKEGKAQQQLLNKRIDIILMDIQMPIMNGFEAIQCIRQLEKSRREQTINHVPMMTIPDDNKPICIIAMSANSEFGTYQGSVHAGADAFLNKPFSIKVLESTIAHCRKQQCLLPLLQQHRNKDDDAVETDNGGQDGNDSDDNSDSIC